MRKHKWIKGPSLTSLAQVETAMQSDNQLFLRDKLRSPLVIAHMQLNTVLKFLRAGKLFWAEKVALQKEKN